MKTTAILAALIVGLSLFPVAAKADASKETSKPAPDLGALVSPQTPLRNGDKIAFFGDSVTMQGGYIRTIAAALMQSPATKGLDVQLLPHGLNGGRVPTILEGKSPWGNLGGTMQELIDKEKPTVIVIYLGINDVWHGEKGTNRTDYAAGLKKMVEMGRKAKATLILCTPTVIGEEMDGKSQLNKTLDDYADIVRNLAHDEKLTLCDLHKAFVEQLTKINTANKHAGNLTYDGVHMNDAGNALLAAQVADALNEALKGRPAK